MSEYPYFPRTGTVCGSCGNLPGQGHKPGCAFHADYRGLPLSPLTRLLRALSGKEEGTGHEKFLAHS
jgi:hypothetical protein